MRAFSAYTFAYSVPLFFIYFSDFVPMLSSVNAHSSNPFPEDEKCIPSSCSRCSYPVYSWPWL